VTKYKLFFLAVLISAVIILAYFTTSSFAATITVSNTNDSGPGSLRNAVSIAAPGDTINFSVTGTLTLTSGALSIGKDLTIVGPGPSNLAISGNDVNRVFNISGGKVDISGLTIKSGSADSGGGIYNAGILKISDCLVTSNSASDYGGGIYNGGTLTAANCAIVNNVAATVGGGVGGGIHNTNIAALTNVTVARNSVRYEGGGVSNDGGTISIINCTISENGAVMHGGIYNFSGAVQLRNTMIANNDSVNCGGTITSLGHNLDSANTCALTGSGDLINRNPLLGPLALNSPGNTPTYALLAGSPAIDAADPGNFPLTDQRGVARPQGASPDIGAYEFVPASSTVVPTMNMGGMIIFVLLAGIASIYYLRRRRTESV
jgi:uncharacterized protein (UPF0333 family)